MVELWTAHNSLISTFTTQWAWHTFKMQSTSGIYIMNIVDIAEVATTEAQNNTISKQLHVIIATLIFFFQSFIGKRIEFINVFNHIIYDFS